MQYLRGRSIKHEDLIDAVSEIGGAQGFCIGFLMAVVVSSARDESDLIKGACSAIRLALDIGIYSEIGAYESGKQSTVVVRTKQANQIQDIVNLAPTVCHAPLYPMSSEVSKLQVHLGAIIDDQTITVESPESVLASPSVQSTHLGPKNRSLHLNGKVHNPENECLAAKLKGLCRQNTELALQQSYPRRGGVRSNASGQLVDDMLVTDRTIDDTLTSSCQWSTIMATAAEGLQKTPRRIHIVLQFGVADSVPTGPFEEQGLDIRRITYDGFSELAASSAIRNSDDSRAFLQPSVEPIAVVGMACRAPDADDVERLWENIRLGRSEMTEVPKTRIDIHGGYRAVQDVKWMSNHRFFGNFISEPDSFDNSFFSLNTREAAAMDPQQRLLLETTYQAVESSGYLHTHRSDKGDDVGVFIGASFVDYEEQLSTHPPSAYTSTGTIRAFLCERISHYFGWSGPAEVIDIACSSSLVATNRACKALQAGV